MFSHHFPSCWVCMSKKVHCVHRLTKIELGFSEHSSGARVSKTWSHPSAWCPARRYEGAQPQGQTADSTLAKGHSPTPRHLPMERGFLFQDVYPGPRSVPGLAWGYRTGRDLSNMPSS